MSPQEVQQPQETTPLQCTVEQSTAQPTNRQTNKPRSVYYNILCFNCNGTGHIASDYYRGQIQQPKLQVLIIVDPISKTRAIRFDKIIITTPIKISKLGRMFIRAIDNQLSKNGTFPIDTVTDAGTPT